LKFAILHHGACDAELFHYRIDRAGIITPETPETDPGAHRKSIGIVLNGDLDQAPPTPAQVSGLQTLLLQLKKRYPDIEVGGHRQVRGNATSCPGERFGLSGILRWAKSELIAQRDASMREEVDRQYYRR
jgi:N-acetyl-anhydromuramyl-L-alanine amidase AmpD